MLIGLIMLAAVTFVAGVAGVGFLTAYERAVADRRQLDRINEARRSVGLAPLGEL